MGAIFLMLFVGRFVVCVECSGWGENVWELWVFWEEREKGKDDGGLEITTFHQATSGVSLSLQAPGIWRRT